MARAWLQRRRRPPLALAPPTSPPSRDSSWAGSPAPDSRRCISGRPRHPVLVRPALRTTSSSYSTPQPPPPRRLRSPSLRVSCPVKLSHVIGGQGTLSSYFGVLRDYMRKPIRIAQISSHLSAIPEFQEFLHVNLIPTLTKSIFGFLTV